MTSAQVLLLALAVGLGLWLLHELGKAVTRLLEAAAAIAVVFVTAWLVVKGLWWLGRQAVRHWRTTLTLAAVGAWWHWCGLLSLAVTVGFVAVVLLVWRHGDRVWFEAWAGRQLRTWCMRWLYYTPRMPRWLRACGLTVPDQGQLVTVHVTPFRRSAVQPRVRPRRDQQPRIVGVRSGGSWDEVRIRLVPGQTPEDYDTAARALAVARGVARCQVRELGPNLVSIDYQRRDRLHEVISCQDLATLSSVAGPDMDLRRVWSGRTEYGTDWHQPLAGGTP
jgi:S-DNA-T family DNA segregation ATPase FtsK/SpoIIIE